MLKLRDDESRVIDSRQWRQGGAAPPAAACRVSYRYRTALVLASRFSLRLLFAVCCFHFYRHTFVQSPLPFNITTMSASTAVAAPSQAAPQQQQMPPQIQYREILQECQQLMQKIAELEVDRNEHVLVEDTLKPLDGSRRAYRLVGDVLVERSVKEVLPSVSQNKDNVSDREDGRVGFAVGGNAWQTQRISLFLSPSHMGIFLLNY
jgi:chaperonin cofactor prefoldin